MYFQNNRLSQLIYQKVVEKYRSDFRTTTEHKEIELIFERLASIAINNKIMDSCFIRLFFYNQAINYSLSRTLSK